MFLAEISERMWSLECTAALVLLQTREPSQTHRQLGRVAAEERAAYSPSPQTVSSSRTRAAYGRLDGDGSLCETCLAHRQRQSELWFRLMHPTEPAWKYFTTDV